MSVPRQGSARIAPRSSGRCPAVCQRETTHWCHSPPGVAGSRKGLKGLKGLTVFTTPTVSPFPGPGWHSGALAGHLTVSDAWEGAAPALLVETGRKPVGQCAL